MNKIILNIIIFFWKLLIRLPRSFQIKISKILGVIIWTLPFNRNKYSKINIESCLKDFSNQNKTQIYRQNIIASGRIIFDTGIFCRRKASQCKNNFSDYRHTDKF